MVRPLLQNTPGWVMMANNMRQTMGMPIDLMDETEVVFQTRRLCEEAEARQAEALKKIKALQLLEIAEAYFQGEASYQLAEDLEEFINQRSHQ